MCSSSGSPFVHAILYAMFFIYLCKQSSRWKEMLVEYLLFYVTLFYHNARYEKHKILHTIGLLAGLAVALFVEPLHYKTEGCGFDSR